MSKRNRKGRAINGILLLDKPKGITSNRALQIVKRLFNAQKAGHTGSLDPLATGMLPLCFGEATKVSGFLLSANKSYVTHAQLGIRTDSADADGNIIESRSAVHITRDHVLSVIEQFRGEISQLPPMHSALKKDGVPLYKLAHQGISVERKHRQVQIYELELQQIHGQFLDLFVKCSKGTYIRTLVDDIGEKLGCGAHVVELRRQQVDPFGDKKMWTIEQLEELALNGLEQLDACLLNTDSALEAWPAVELPDDASFYLCRGQPVFMPKVVDRGWVRLYKDDGGFLGIGEVDNDGKISPKRLMEMGNIG